MASDDVTPITKNKDKPAGKPKAQPAKGAAKKAAAAKKASAPKKAASNRTPTIVSKEGTQKDAFTGEVLPVTAFPTIRNSKTGKNDARGPVARKNLEAYRAANKVKREAAKKAKDAEKAKAKADKEKAAAKAKADKAEADAKKAAEAKAAADAAAKDAAATG